MLLVTVIIVFIFTSYFRDYGVVVFMLIVIGIVVVVVVVLIVMVIVIVIVLRTMKAHYAF